MTSKFPDYHDIFASGCHTTSVSSLVPHTTDVMWNCLCVYAAHLSRVIDPYPQIGMRVLLDNAVVPNPENVASQLTAEYATYYI